MLPHVRPSSSLSRESLLIQGLVERREACCIALQTAALCGRFLFGLGVAISGQKFMAASGRRINHPRDQLSKVRTADPMWEWMGFKLLPRQADIVSVRV